MDDLTPMFQAARQAAALCKNIQERLSTVASKGGAEPVTIADYGSQALICRAISLAFPDDAVIAEEGGKQFSDLISSEDQQDVVQLVAQVLDMPVSVEDIVRWLDYGQGYEAARTWVIDPIDGTKGYIALRNYAIAIGLLENDRPTSAVMATPGYAGFDGGALFYAFNGQAWVEPLQGGQPEAIRASQRTTTDSLVIVESVEKAHADQDVMAQVRQQAGMETAQVNRLDSQEKYCLVASGEADAYLRLPFKKGAYSHKIWDHAAGVAIVEAAGGLVTDLDGSPLDFSLGKTLAKNKGMIVANPYIHEQLVEAASHFDF